VQASGGKERMSLKKSFSGWANSGSRREVRNKCLSFQGGIFCAAELFRQSRNLADVGHHCDP
jgi:hypothetical protein